jgi:hypothetical protein
MRVVIKQLADFLKGSLQFASHAFPAVAFG